MHVGTQRIKMIAALSRWRDVFEPLSYQSQEEKLLAEGARPQLIWASVSSNSIRQAAREFETVASLRPDVKRPYLHGALALQDERLGRIQWVDVSKAFLSEIELDPAQHPCLVRRHYDTSHDHVDFVICRVSVAGFVWRGEFELFKAIAACNAVERRFGLRASPGLRGSSHAHASEHPARTARHRKMLAANRRAKKRGTRIQDWDKMESTLRDIAARAGSIEEFIFMAYRMEKSYAHGELGLKVREVEAVEFVGLSAVTRGAVSARTLQQAFAERGDFDRESSRIDEDAYGEPPDDFAERAIEDGDACDEQGNDVELPGGDEEYRLTGEDDRFSES